MKYTIRIALALVMVISGLALAGCEEEGPVEEEMEEVEDIDELEELEE